MSEPDRPRVIRLVADGLESLWLKQDFSKIFRESVTSRNAVEHLHYLQSQGGEALALMEATDELWGWIGLVPDADRSGRCFTITGHEVHSDHRGQGIGRRLLEEAKLFIQARGVQRLKFWTSPLLTLNAWLYVRRSGCKYTWINRIRLEDGKPWPWVRGEWDSRRPEATPPDLEKEEVRSLNVLEWQGLVPRPRSPTPGSRAVTLTLPPITLAVLNEAVRAVGSFLETIFALLDSLNRQGYGFLWFDRLEEAKGGLYYYTLTKEVNILTF